MKAVTGAALALLFATVPACGQRLVDFPIDEATPDAAKAEPVIPDGGPSADAVIDAPVIDTEATDAGTADGSAPGDAVVALNGLAMRSLASLMVTEVRSVSQAPGLRNPVEALATPGGGQ